MAPNRNFNPLELEFSGECAKGECFDCVQTNLEQSEAGRRLGEIGVRYSRFAWEDTEKFKKFMGDDVDPVQHGLHQARTVAMPLIVAQNHSYYRYFTKDEARSLLVGTILHDAHEGTTGDLPMPDKTAEIDKAEAEVNRDIVRGLGVSAIIAADLYDMMTDVEQKTFLGKAFKATEYIGYLNTGLRAWSLREHHDLTPEEQDASFTMGASVVISTLDVLEKESSRHFALPRTVLNANHNAIQEIVGA